MVMSSVPFGMWCIVVVYIIGVLVIVYVHTHTHTHTQSPDVSLAHERATAEQLEEAKQLWTTHHMRGVATQPRDSNDPM